MPAPTCPCGLPQPYAACCGRFHDGAAPPTAELLMRSRYTAFVRSDEEYLLRTWDPATRPQTLGLNPRARWTGLEIRGVTDGGLFAQTGTVHFRAHHAGGVVEEDSAFRKLDGHWVYVGPV
ncbi:YchJ family protein [Pseudonocardia sp. CA-107938]|uniref:YchJ family protein n=1 Tax=Pseudonocardia sp. CA-107938 TaxID=3240021 RepID=UPI003D916DCB